MSWIEDMFSPDFDEKWEQCSHCNGYGSSLKESSAKCTRCGGSGLIKREGGDEANVRQL